MTIPGAARIDLDAGFGELFIVRVAGNVISPEVIGTLQYAGVHLRTPCSSCYGHRGCGAINAALAVSAQRTEPARIALLLDDVLPGLRRSPALNFSGRRDAHSRSEGANVRWSMRQLLETPEAKARLVESAMKLVGDVYNLESGRVQFLQS